MQPTSQTLPRSILHPAWAGPAAWARGGHVTAHEPVGLRGHEVVLPPIARVLRQDALLHVCARQHACSGSGRGSIHARSNNVFTSMGVQAAALNACTMGSNAVQLPEACCRGGGRGAHRILESPSKMLCWNRCVALHSGRSRISYQRALRGGATGATRFVPQSACNPP